ncbi:hypothetical protein HOLleu_27841 [Holothuria leucospilota]|uniref:Uncharacterized protein n=1 Tax=Holothuria leucospilota TaxID=206669 RepID=A0A9Q1BR58_HOLLE|nr:hypothetical protein HOLleu_27841 [Holothuria leucospilota]
MEPTAFVLCAQHKQWSRENKPVSHNWKKGCGHLDLNQLVGNWGVKPHLTNLTLICKCELSFVHSINNVGTWPHRPTIAKVA